MDVSEIIIHPEYRDPAYSFDQEGPKLFRLHIWMIFLDIKWYFIYSNNFLDISMISF